MPDIRSKGSTALIAQMLIYLIMIVFTVMAIYPILWLVIQSFKTTQDYLRSSKLALPSRWFLRNYYDSWTRAKFGMLIINSLIYTIVTVTLTIVFGFMAGFAFSKIPSKATKIIHGTFIIGILLTLQSIMVPLFLMVNAAGLYNTRIGILIPYIGISLPMSVYLSTEYIRSVPDALIESARIDGAKYLKIFSSIIVPMSAPIAVTVAILSVTGIWNEFMLINILSSSDAIKSLPVGIAKFSGALASDYGKQFAALVIGFVPMVVFYVIFRKQITQGVAAGAVKG